MVYASTGQSEMQGHSRGQVSTLHGLLGGVQNALQKGRSPQLRGAKARAQILGSIFWGTLHSLQVFKGRKLVFCGSQFRLFEFRNNPA